MPRIIPFSWPLNRSSVGRGALYLSRGISRLGCACVRIDAQNAATVATINWGLIAARWRWLTFSPRMRGEKVGAYRAPAMTATFAFRRTARMRPAAWRVPGGHDGQQGEAPGRVARSAGQ